MNFEDLSRQQLSLLDFGFKYSDSRFSSRGLASRARTGLGNMGFLNRAARLCGLSIDATYVLSSTIAERMEMCILGII